ncbi:MAG: response regulator, partial [Campylobacterales bacterium]
MEDIRALQEETSKLSVLYVEDDDSAREQIQSILEILFKKIYVATDGAEGIEIFRDNHSKIDLVITDVQMPVMNGLEMSSKIKEISPHKHILILSAHNDISYFSLAIDIGVDGFIIKPIVTDKFLKAIKKSIRQIKSQKIEESYQDELKSQLEKRTKELEDSLITDELTGLPNKASLNLELSSSGDFTALLINIDNFDHINSTYGYDIGDIFLQQTAIFLSQFKNGSSKLYRLTSDEFVYLFKNSEKSEITLFAEKIIEAFSSTRFRHNEIEIALTCTIGIARGSNKQALVDAHIAMKEVREIGKNRYYFYTANSELRSRQKNNIEWMLKVKNALEQDLVIPYFQPIINNQSGEIEKYECLARIVDAQRIITPNFFIEPARLVGMLPNITKVMIDKCFKRFENSQSEFSLNISECDLKEGFLLDILPEMLDRYSINPNRV